MRTGKRDNRRPFDGQAMLDPASAPPALSGPQADQAAVLGALDLILGPLARLCVARGVSIQALEEHVRRAVVRAARDACEHEHPHHPPHRLTSRISTMTGLTRREVARLEAHHPPKRNTSRSLVADVLAHWQALPGARDDQGAWQPLPRTGPAPSFESLAAQVTQDVHPRSLLDELLRLGWVSHDLAHDWLTLCPEAFVPRHDVSQMLRYLGDNVGDHLEAAVLNVLGDGRAHFEQALFADELSAESLAQIRPLIAAQWQHLLTTLAPALSALMDEDRAQGRLADQCVRLGLYSFSRPMIEPPPAPASDS